mmetsp:Transcript_45697/g.129427  ORF Transcript_45697/g.129427 Transcript_45697/m.129427 type:complete len:261 (+) Transcript_45697:3-785(+)
MVHPRPRPLDLAGRGQAEGSEGLRRQVPEARLPSHVALQGLGHLRVVVADPSQGVHHHQEVRNGDGLSINMGAKSLQQRPEELRGHLLEVRVAVDDDGDLVRRQAAGPLGERQREQGEQVVVVLVRLGPSVAEHGQLSACQPCQVPWNLRVQDLEGLHAQLQLRASVRHHAEALRVETPRPRAHLRQEGLQQPRLVELQARGGVEDHGQLPRRHVLKSRLVAEQLLNQQVQRILLSELELCEGIQHERQREQIRRGQDVR